MSRDPESRIEQYQVPTSVEPEDISSEEALTHQALRQALSGKEITNFSIKKGLKSLGEIAHGATSIPEKPEEPDEIERIEELTGKIAELRNLYRNDFKEAA